MSNDEFHALRYALNHGLVTHQRDIHYWKLAIIKNLRKYLVIVKPDEGNGIVLLNASGYYKGVQTFFQDKLKFKQNL